MIVHSAIYEGAVEHHRRTPRQHRFRQRLALLYLDLDEAPDVFRLTPHWRREHPALASFHRSDYLAGEADLATAARDGVERLLGWRPEGAVRLLTQVRFLGYVFNPVSFYYCHDRDGHLAAVLAEITNTPWGQRHRYAIDCRHRPSARFDKAFHVSPFMPMEQEYEWRFTAPSNHLAVRMRNLEGGSSVFSATLAMTRRPLTAAALNGVLVRYPAQTIQAIVRIHWEALRLWWKGVPFHTHPDKRHQAAHA